MEKMPHSKNHRLELGTILKRKSSYDTISPIKQP
jgi:hypothetical protein